MKEEEKYKIPKGLYKCLECGKYKGNVKRGDLNNDCNESESEEMITVTCLCNGGLLCPKCKKTRIWKPESNEYDPNTNTVWYLSGMAGMNPKYKLFLKDGCEECKK